MFVLDIALRVAVLSQLAFIAVLLVRAGWPLTLARALALTLVTGVAAYMYCSNGQHTPTALSVPLITLCILIPPVFWLFASAAFDDSFRLQPWHAVPVGAALVLGLSTFLNPDASWAVAAGLTGRILSLAFILAALWIAFRGRGHDLVESRRKFRDWLTAILGLYMLGIVVAEIALLGKEPTAWANTLNVGAILIVAHFAGHALSNARVRALEAVPSAESNPVQPEDRDALALAALREAMEVKLAYQENGLTVGGLASRIGLQEYALRRLINQRLGFRNFNDFLNRYRIRDACARLRAPATAKLPVLTIALDVGYSSITPFNRAFKELLGMTPTAYREAKEPPSI
ncbi:MAG TPA: helix-turn-helix transcriptional regulator [Steroidobacteraceae bacterium]|nr:helix-turn-helix transcriptional regulator [Steroidobacteraceae bacterium]